MIKKNNSLIKLPTRLLAIIAHEDDEIACGGLLAKNIKLGGESHVICFGGSTELRSNEFENSCKILRVTFELLKKQESKYDENSIQTTDKISDIIIEKKPEFILTHRPKWDYHKDHRDVSRITKDSCIRAHTKKNRHDVKGILYSEATSLHPIVHVFINITNEYEQLFYAFNQHKSQIDKLEGYYLKELDFLTKLRGLHAGCNRAQAFIFEPLQLISAFNRGTLGE